MPFSVYRVRVQPDGVSVQLGDEILSVEPENNPDILPTLQAAIGGDVILEANRQGAILYVQKAAVPQDYIPTTAPPTIHRLGTTLHPLDRKTPLKWRSLWSMTHTIEPAPDENPPWNTALNRSPAALQQIIQFLNVEKTLRYAPRDNITCCTIFVSDVTRMMGCEVCLDPQGAKRWSNRNANIFIQYFQQVSIPKHGWEPIPNRKEAQNIANQGYPVIGYWRNATGPGHMFMVVPGALDSEGRPFVAQAGAKVFSAGRWDHPDVKFIGHE